MITNSIKFYLQQEECDAINSFRKEVKKKFEAEPKMADMGYSWEIRRMWQLIPNTTCPVIPDKNGPLIPN